jgi:hypothetical protein
MNTQFKKMASRILLTAFTASLFVTTGSSFAATPTYKVGDKYTPAGKTAVILQHLAVDLNKDKKDEHVYLVGNLFKDSTNYYEKLTYVITDGKTHKTSMQVIKDGANNNLGGYDPAVSITDLNKDGQSDLFLSTPTGGSGGYVSYDLSTMKNGKLTSYLVTESNDLKGLTISGKFLDNYQVELFAKEINKNWTLDVSSNKALYLEMKVYDQNGKFIGSQTPDAYEINHLEIVDTFDGQMIKANQRITGIANVDTLANLNIYLSYENAKWHIRGVTQTIDLAEFK